MRLCACGFRARVAAADLCWLLVARSLARSGLHALFRKLIQQWFGDCYGNKSVLNTLARAVLHKAGLPVMPLTSAEHTKACVLVRQNVVSCLISHVVGCVGLSLC